MNRIIIVSGIVIAIVIVGIVLITRHFQIGVSPMPSSSVAVVTTSPTITPPPGALSEKDYLQFTKPATCKLTGSVQFVSNSTAKDSARIAYTGIDSPARQITWTVTPKDAIKVGPNIAASLPLPDGSQMVTVVLPKNPIAKSYVLRASMNYGRLVSGDVKVYEVNCSGQIPVTLAY